MGTHCLIAERNSKTCFGKEDKLETGCMCYGCEALILVLK